MAHLIVPVPIDNVLRCCDPETRRTKALLEGSAVSTGPNEWRVYEASAPGSPETNERAESEDVIEGAVKFGICCASVLELELEGRIETLNTGFDWIEVWINGERVFDFESTETTEDPWDTISAGPFTLSFSLDDRPCGHVIEIRGSTGDEVANNGVWWDARVLDIR